MHDAHAGDTDTLKISEQLCVCRDRITMGVASMMCRDRITMVVASMICSILFDTMKISRSRVSSDTR